MTGYWFGIIVGLFFASILGLIYLAYVLARNDLFFTIVKEGTAKIVLRFDKVNRVLFSYTGHRLNEEGDIEPISEPINIADLEDIEEEAPKDIGKKIRDMFGGLYWIGIPEINKIYTYKMDWLSFDQTTDESGKIIQKAIPAGGLLDYVSLKDEIFYAIVDEAETRDMVPIDLYFQLTFRVINPQKALFKVDNWIEISLNQFKPVLRNWIATKKIEELIGAPEVGVEKKQLGEEAKQLITDSSIDKRLKEDYGVELSENGYGIALIAFSGERGAKYVESLTKDWEAKKEAQRMEIVYEQLKKSGPTGEFARLLEALEKTSKNPNKMVIFPLGSIQDIMRAWTGRSGN